MVLRNSIQFYLLCCTVTIGQSDSTTSYYHEPSVITIKPSQKLVEDAYFGYSMTYVRSVKRLSALLAALVVGRWEAARVPSRLHPTPAAYPSSTGPESYHQAACHRQATDSTVQEPMLVISAPNSDNVGKIFLCGLEDATCSEVASDLHNKTRKKQDQHVHFWNGASVVAGKSFFVACAPRLVKWYEQPKAWLSFGQCYKYTTSDGGLISHQLKHVQITRDRRTKKDFADSFGWSISVVDEDLFAVGGPAYGSGRIAVYEKKQPVLKWAKPNGIEYSFGYSIILRNTKQTNEGKNYFSLGIIASSPYGAHGKGKIHITNYTKTFVSEYDTVWIINDNSVGSMFGASLCLMRHDKTEYLLVGSPAYAEQKSRKYDQGKVDVYAHYDMKYKKRKSATIYGPSSNGGYFGHAIVNLGDLNNDLVDDIAISAPFENDSLGAIYIYSGASLLNRENTWLQRIQAREHRFLGLSMVALKDYDDNGCSALAVGAPGSNRAVVFRCMGSVQIEVGLSLKTNELNTSSTLRALDEDNSKQYTFYSCINAKYPGKPVKINLDLEIEVTARHLEENTAMVWIYNLSFSEKKSIYCNPHTLNLTKNLDYTLPLITNITAVRRNNPLEQKHFDPSLVMLSDSSVLSRQEDLYMEICKGECTPNLLVLVNVSFKDQYKIGSSDEEQLSIIVQNIGDPAYKVSVVVQVLGVAVKRAPQCQRERLSETWRCPSKGPLWALEAWKLEDISLEMNTLTSANERIQVIAHVVDADDKVTSLLFHLIVDEQDIVITGLSNYNEVLNITTGTEKRVEHIYLITNNGITNWVDLECELQFPKAHYITAPTGVTDLVLLDDQTSCSLNENPNDTVMVTCTIPFLKKAQTIKIVGYIEIKPLSNDIFKDTFSSKLSLKIKNTRASASVSNSVRFVKIPVYVIVMSVVFGILLLLIIAFALYKLGLLKRKNKEKLIKLQEKVKRKTMMRQSLVASVEGENASADQVLKEIEFIGEITESNYE